MLSLLSVLNLVSLESVSFIPSDKYCLIVKCIICKQIKDSANIVISKFFLIKTVGRLHIFVSQHLWFCARVQHVCGVSCLFPLNFKKQRCLWLVN